MLPAEVPRQLGTCQLDVARLVRSPTVVSRQLLHDTVLASVVEHVVTEPAPSPRHNGEVNVRYVCDGEVIWSPAEHTDAVFRAMIELCEQRNDLASGIVWHGDGSTSGATVDTTELAVFAQTVVGEWETVGSTVFHQLADGFVAVLQVIAERCAVELEVGDEAYALATTARHNM